MWLNYRLVIFFINYRKNEVKSSANGMCIDSMEQPVGREVELYECHGEGRNQVNCTFLSRTCFLLFGEECLLFDSFS